MGTTVAVGNNWITGSVVVGIGSGNVLKTPPPPVKPGIPPPRFKAIIEVSVGIVGGIVTLAVTVGKTEVIVGVNGNGGINVVGMSVPAVILIRTETVGVGGGARVGTKDVTVNPAIVTWGTVTVTGVKLANGIAWVLKGCKAEGNTGNWGKKVGNTGVLKNGLKLKIWASAFEIIIIENNIRTPNNNKFLFSFIKKFNLLFFISIPPKKMLTV